MRILIVHNSYAQRGGEDAVVAAEIAALRERGHQVELLLRDSAALHAHPAQGAGETMLTVFNPHAAAELARALRSVRPDVVHVHNLFPRWGLAALRVLAAHRVPTVQTLHNFRWLCAPATFLRDGRDCTRCMYGNFTDAVRFACMPQGRVVSAAYALALSHNRATALAERAITRFVCVSQFVRGAYEQAGFPADKMRVKGHFVTRAPGASDAGDGTVLYAGRLSAEKGVAVLLEAMQLLPDVTLKIAGDGPEQRALAANVGAARVRFLGRLTAEALQHERSQSSLCAVPSTGNETFGLAALEAFACGRPVVATDAGGLPELVRDGENGWVVARHDARALAERIRWLIDHPEAARTLGKAGHALVQERYLPASNMEQLEDIYRAAISALKA